MTPHKFISDLYTCIYAHAYTYKIYFKNLKKNLKPEPKTQGTKGSSSLEELMMGLKESRRVIRTRQCTLFLEKGPGVGRVAGWPQFPRVFSAHVSYRQT